MTSILRLVDASLLPFLYNSTSLSSLSSPLYLLFLLRFEHLLLAAKVGIELTIGSCPISLRMVDAEAESDWSIGGCCPACCPFVNSISAEEAV